MIVFVPFLTDKPMDSPAIPKFDGLKMDRKDFLDYPFNEPEFKYECIDGVLEAEVRLKREERAIVDRLLRAFYKTESFRQGDNLLPESDVFLKKINQIRRPDLTLFKKEQIHNSNELDSVPSFIIEIISPSNTVTEIENKLQDYFQTGVEVVWLLFPELQSVKIYTSIKSVRICTDNDICDAGDAIPDFQISVGEIFS